MKLPEWLDQQVWHEIETIEESEKMQYITSVKRIGIAKGGYQLNPYLTPFSYFRHTANHNLLI